MKAFHFKTWSFLFMVVFIFNCKNDKKKTSEETIQESTSKTSNSIRYSTDAMEFNGPDTMPSGWNTIRYKNNSEETHFLVFEKYPEGITIDSTRAQVFPVFDKGMTLINEGNAEAGFKAFNDLPAWFFKVVFTGGVGLVSPKETAISTIKLDHGNYLIECYVKMKNGKFHSVMGMYKAITVTEKQSDTKEPTPTITVDISSEKGMVFNPNIKSGNQIIQVNFIDQKLHEHFLGHDVNLVKLEPHANLEDLNAWMSWTNPKGFITPAPEGVAFIGGVQEMPAGHTGYFNVALTKGKYAFVSEVPNSKTKNMLKVFEVID